MAPEQVAGLRVDHRSDIFAAGIVLTELLLGRRLFLGRSDFETLDKVLNTRLDVLKQHEAALPKEIVVIAYRALQRSPEDRYQSARDFQEDIVEFLYERRERITNEMLAAFVAQHVVPHVGIAKPQEPGQASDQEVLQSSHERDHESGVQLLRRQDLPHSRKAKSAASVESEIPFLAEEHVKEVDGSNDSDRARRPAQDPAPAAASPSMSGAKHSGTVEAPASTGMGTVQPASAALLPGVGLAGRVPESGWETSLPDAVPSEAPAVQPSAHMAQVVEYQFGAIPEIDLNTSGDTSHLELDLSRYANGGPGDDRAPAPSLDEIGQELDLSVESGSDPSARPIPVETNPHALLTARLRSAEEASTRDRPGFAGSLQTRTTTKVLFRFALVKETGLLTLTGPKDARESDLEQWLAQVVSKRTSKQVIPAAERTCEIHLLGGAPHLVAADRSEESLIRHLIASKQVKQDAVGKALEHHAHRGLIAAIVAAGLVSPLQISRKVTSMVLDTVFSAFAWTAGRFAFYGQKQCSEEAFPTGLSSMEFITQGVGTLGPTDLQQYFARLQGHYLVARKTPPLEVQSMSASPTLTAVYRAVGSQQTVAEVLQICEPLADLLTVKRAIYTAIECELVDVT
jgi:hypothetical protein